MSPLVFITIYGWIPFVFYLFTRFPAQRAVIISFMVPLLFLPESVEFNLLHPLPALSKTSVPCYGVLLATIFFDSGRFSSFKPSWIDLPMLIWCLVCPIASQITNGLSPISPFLSQLMTWGLPYYLGRLYLNDLAGLRQLAIAIFTSGLIYAPLSLLEMRIAPTLHMRLYGFHAREDFSQTMRYGGYRPTVFMTHGLWVGLWMMIATLVGIWLWKTGVIKKLWNISISWLVVGLLITFVLCKSTGAYVLLVLGVIILLTSKWLRTAIPLLLLIVAMSFQLNSRVNRPPEYNPSSDPIISLSNSVFGQDRASSVEFRIENEKLMAAQARQKMIFGWGDSGGYRIRDEKGRDISITDSVWIIVFGTYGLLGLISWAASILLPVVSFCVLRYPASSWSNPKVAPAAMLSVAVTLWMMDCLTNAMVTPIYLVTCGGISGLMLEKPETNKVRSTRPSVARRSLAQQRQH